jgi:poly(beta-D-mannuronate) lyase
MSRLSKLLSLAIVLGLAPWHCKARSADHSVATVEEIDEAINDAQPGDTITLRNGDWKDFDILFDAVGTAGAPITLRPERPGQVVVTGPTALRIGGRHLVVSGLVFRGAYNDDHLIAFRRNSKQLAEHCRLTDCVIEDCNHPTDAGESRWITLYGRHNRVDHCSISGKTTKGTTVVAFLGKEPNHHQIDHNYFGPREKLGKNGGETIRIGDSDTSQLSSRTVVEHNVFDRCNGEAEIISNKSCDNVYRYNVFRRCAGALTLRHGHGATVEGNYFLGEKARGTGGVRVIGERHRVINNYFSDLEGDDHRAALSIMNGFLNSPPDGYEPVKDVLIAFNTFINCKETFVIGLTEEGDPDVPPTNCTIANNLLVTRRQAVDVRTEPQSMRWLGNLVQGELGYDIDGVRAVADLQLKRFGECWQLTPASQAVDAAAAGIEAVAEDINRHPRRDPMDVGCQELSMDQQLSPVTDREDAGPTWQLDSAD